MGTTFARCHPELAYLSARYAVQAVHACATELLAAPVRPTAATASSWRIVAARIDDHHARRRGAGARPMRPAPLHDARDDGQLVGRDLCAVGEP